jgi:hypothetical protein
MNPIVAVCAQEQSLSRPTCVFVDTREAVSYGHGDLRSGRASRDAHASRRVQRWKRCLDTDPAAEKSTTWSSENDWPRVGKKLVGQYIQVTGLGEAWLALRRLDDQ